MSDPTAVRENIKRLFSNLRHAIDNDHYAIASLTLTALEKQWHTIIPGDVYRAFLDRETELACQSAEGDVSLPVVIAELIDAATNEPS